MKEASVNWTDILNFIIDQTYSNSENVDFSKILELLAKKVNATAGFIIFIPNDDINYIVPEAVYNIKKENVSPFSLNDKRLSNYSAENASLVIYPSGGDSDQWFHSYTNVNFDVKTEIVAPLIYNKQTFGTITLSFQDLKNEFFEREKVHFESVVKTIGLSYQTKLFKQISSLSSETFFVDQNEIQICEQLSETGVEIAKTSIARIRLIENNQLKLMSFCNSCSGEIFSKEFLAEDIKSFSWKVVNNTREFIRKNSGKISFSDDIVLHIPDLDKYEFELSHHQEHKLNGIKSLICVPIVAQKEVIGVLNIYAKRINVFNKHQIYFLSNLARSAGEAIKDYRRVNFKNELNKKCTTISRISERNELFKQIKIDLIEFFNCDYFLIFGIDPFSKEINKLESYLESDSLNKNRERDIRFSNDYLEFIRCLLANKGQRYIKSIRNSELLEKYWDSDSSWKTLNIKDHQILKENYVDFEQYYYPLMLRNEKAESDQVIGMIEFGYRDDRSYLIPNSFQSNISIYLENCVETFSKIWEIENEDKNNSFLAKSFDKYYDHEEFVRNSLGFISEEIGANKGEFGLIGFFNKEEWYPSISICYQIEPDNLKKIRQNSIEKGKIGIYRKVYSNRKYFFSKGSLEDDQNYIPGLEDVNSQISVPIYNRKELMGVASFFSDKTDAFNRFHAEWIIDFLEKVTRIYLRKKTLVSLDKLVRPFNLSLDVKSAYLEVVEHLTNYFGDCYVGTWKRNNAGKTNNFSQVYSSEILERKLIKANYSNFNIDNLESFFEGESSKLISTKDLTDENIEFIPFIESELKFIILSPIMFEKEIVGIISIFSEQEITSLSSEEEAYLKILARKTAIHLQNSSMTKKFLEVPEYFVHGDIDFTLENIVQDALEVVGANPVVLFPYNASIDEFSSPIIEGDFEFEKIKRISKDIGHENELVRKIINTEDDWWIENRIDYDKKNDSRIYQNKSFKNDFYTRENIKSFAAIRLIKNEKCYGVMFFNFRQEKQFSDTLKERFIRVFSDLAANNLDMAASLKSYEEIMAQRMELSHEVLHSEIGAGMVHESGHLVFETSHNINELKELIDNSKVFDDEKILDKLDVITDAIESTEINYLRLRNFRKWNDKIFKEKIHINTIVESPFAILKSKFKKKRIKESFKLLGEKEDAYIYCDVKLLQHVILNLLINSWDAMNNGDKIEISTFYTSKNREKLSIRIHDFGIGMDESEKRQVFRPYYSKKKGSKKGTGMGLPISKNIVETIHDGSIELKTEKNKYTQFDIVLNRLKK